MVVPSPPSAGGGAGDEVGGEAGVSPVPTGAVGGGELGDEESPPTPNPPPPDVVVGLVPTPAPPPPLVGVPSGAALGSVAIPAACDVGVSSFPPC